MDRFAELDGRRVGPRGERRGGGGLGPVGGAFTRTFEQLWTTGAVQDTRRVRHRAIHVGGATIRPWFSPGRGRKMAHRIATAMGRAERRVRIASPVLTAGSILGTVADVAADGPVDLAGILDATQMREVMAQWAEDQAAEWKPPAIRSLLEHAPFAGKVSTPWRPDAMHDYMHAKVTVADDLVFLGSYNLSNSGQQNAENVLEIVDRRAGRPDGPVRRRPPGSLPAVGAVVDVRPLSPEGRPDRRHPGCGRASRARSISGRARPALATFGVSTLALAGSGMARVLSPPRPSGSTSGRP